MNGLERETKQRNQEIARNESERQTRGDVRVSTWAIAIAVIVVVVGFAIGGLWLRH